MNIWVVRSNFDRPHIFIGDVVYICQLTDEYMRRMPTITGPPIFVSLETGRSFSPFSAHAPLFSDHTFFLRPRCLTAATSQHRCRHRAAAAYVDA
jgi:hypothetical protein